MKKPNRVSDRRSVKLENILSENYIPFLEGRPNRDTVISSDDILNLKIALNQSSSFKEFLERV
jgi:hypothetical protein